MLRVIHFLSWITDLYLLNWILPVQFMLISFKSGSNFVQKFMSNLRFNFTVCLFYCIDDISRVVLSHLCVFFRVFCLLLYFFYCLLFSRVWGPEFTVLTLRSHDFRHVRLLIYARFCLFRFFFLRLLRPCLKRWTNLLVTNHSQSHWICSLANTSVTEFVRFLARKMPYNEFHLGQ